MSLVGVRGFEPPAPASRRQGSVMIAYLLQAQTGVRSSARAARRYVENCVGLVQVPSHRATDSIDVIQHLRASKTAVREAPNSL